MIENGVVVTHYKNNDEIYGVKWTDEGLLLPLMFSDDYGAYRHNVIYYLKIEKDIIKQIIDDCLDEKNSEGVEMRPIYAEKLKNSYGWWEGNSRHLTRDEVRHYFDAMIDAQPTAEAEPRWIPCSERMPPEGENVLLCSTLLGNVAMGKLIRYNTSCCWEVDHWDYDTEEWQAWMPLPKPYREVEE